MANQDRTTDFGRKLYDEAVAARANGQRYFSASFTTDFYRFNATGYLYDWQHYINVLATLGYRLVQWQVTIDPHGHPVAWPVFEDPTV